jgi:exoribonuclease R
MIHCAFDERSESAALLPDLPIDGHARTNTTSVFTAADVLLGLEAIEARLDVGDRVRVELIRTDLERGFIDFRRPAEVP